MDLTTNNREDKITCSFYVLKSILGVGLFYTPKLKTGGQGEKPWDLGEDRSVGAVAGLTVVSGSTLVFSF
jgi:hypothetical protein